MASVEKDLPEIPIEKWLTARQVAAKLFRTEPSHIATYRKKALPKNYWQRTGQKILYRPETAAWIEDFNSRR